MKQKTLMDVSIEIDPPRVPFWIHNGDTEKEAKYLESWCRDFEEFVRDHRSQDPVSLTVKRVYKDLCSHCGYEWEEDESGPLCCHKAIVEHEAAQVTP